MNSPTQKSGQDAEVRAEAFLISKGLQPVARNVFFKTGELDLVMRDGDTLVFVEVRRRKSNRFGSPAESITQSKQNKLILTALLYCQKYKVRSPWRIDVVTVLATSSLPPELNWLPSAITADG